MNRVLRLDEVKHRTFGNVYVDLKHDGHTRTFQRRGYQDRDYGVTWRCWMYPPTEGDRMKPFVDPRNYSYRYFLTTGLPVNMNSDCFV